MMNYSKKNVLWFDNLINLRLDKIPKINLIAFLTTIIVGAIIHIVAITGMLVNWDVLYFGPMPNYDALIGQGKPLFAFTSQIIGVLNIGSYSSVIAIFFIALSASLVCSILEIKKALNASIIGSIMIAFPTVMCTFVYDSESVFFFAMFLSVLGVYYIKKNTKANYLLGTIILICSLLTYQAYIQVSTSLLIFISLLALLNNDKLKNVVINGFKYITSLIVSCCAYYCILNIILSIKKISLSGYRGLDTMGDFSISSFPSLIKDAYMKVFLFFCEDRYGAIGILNLKWLYISTCILFFVFLILIIKNKKMYKCAGRLILITILIILIPMGLHLIVILGQNANTHWLMIYSFVLVFVFLVKFIEMYCDLSIDNFQKTKVILPIISVVLLISLIFQWFTITNAGYTRLRLGYEAAYAVCVQVKTDITNYENYDISQPVYITSPPRFKWNDQLNMLNSYTSITNGNIFHFDVHFISMMKDYLMTSYPSISSDEQKCINNSEQYKAMPAYPNNGYIELINDVLVVKLSE